MATLFVLSTENDLMYAWELGNSKINVYIFSMQPDELD